MGKKRKRKGNRKGDRYESDFNFQGNMKVGNIGKGKPVVGKGWPESKDF